MHARTLSEWINCMTHLGRWFSRTDHSFQKNQRREGRWLVGRWLSAFFLGVNSTNQNYHLEIKIPHERLIPRRLQLLRFTYTESLTPIHRVFCISMSVTLPHLNKYKCTIRTNKRGMRSRYFPFFGVPLNSSLYNPNRTWSTSVWQICPKESFKRNCEISVLKT